MKNLSVKFIGVDEAPDLNLSFGANKVEQEKKEVVTVEDVVHTSELPQNGDKVTIDRDVLETLLLLAKEKKSGGNSNPSAMMKN